MLTQNDVHASECLSVAPLRQYYRSVNGRGERLRQDMLIETANLESHLPSQLFYITPLLHESTGLAGYR